VIREAERKTASGYLALVLLFGATALFTYLLIRAGNAGDARQVVLMSVALAVVLVLWFGLFVVHPNQAKVLQLFGQYVGTVRTPGLQYANPFYTKKKVSVRVRNFETTS
jgi:regulator of protease activity HflC (stomatin/prohibitin superfamily)